jgi:hypothetical protein
MGVALICVRWGRGIHGGDLGALTISGQKGVVDEKGVKARDEAAERDKAAPGSRGGAVSSRRVYTGAFAR